MKTPGLIRLLEREAELEALREAIAATRSGQVILVEGAPGIGKTSLVDAGAELACEAGLRVLRARASQLELEFPFGVVRQLLEPPLRNAAAEERSELLAGAAALAEPVLSERPQPRAAAASPDDAFAALHGLYWLSANLAERGPLLLAIDDLHWSDAPSLRYLALLAARADELPIVLLAATRRGEEGADPVAYAELCSAPAAVALSPSPLSEAAVERIVSAQLGSVDQEFARACHQAVAGNPFLLVQLVAELRREGIAPRADNADDIRGAGPRAVSRSMLARLGGLPRGAPKLAAAVAVLGGGAELRHAATLAGIDTGDAASAADALARSELFGRGVLDFVHPIVRQAVYEDIGEHERSLKHREAARMLAAEGAAPERVAVHLLAAEPVGDPWVVDWLREAAAASLSRADPGTAARYLCRALREPPSPDERVDILRRLGSAELLAAEPAGFHRLGEARELSEDPLERADIALELAPALTPVGDFGRVEQLLEESLTETAGTDRELTLMLEAELAAALQNLPGGFARLDRFEDLTDELTGETPAERMALACLTMVCLRPHRSREAVERFGSMALGDGRLLAEQGPGSMVGYAVASLITAEAFELAEREARRMLEASRGAGSIVGAGIASILLSWIAFGRGDARRAEEYARQAVDSLQGAGWALASALAALIDALVERDDLDAGLAELERSGYERGVPEITPFMWLLAARGRLHAARGDAERGLSDLLAAGRYSVAAGLDNPAVCAWRSEAALIRLRLGERDEALRLAEEELRLAEDFGARRAIGVALRARGLCETDARGIDYLRRAVDVLAGSEARLEHARALTDLGAALRRSNHRSQARLPLTEGLDIARRCGATVLAERAGQELKATGARPRAVPLSGAESLTASERRVCQLAAEGLTNREIAQALFVTLRTIETHLTGAYRKLGISSRRELHGALAHETEEPVSGASR